ncbi:MAG: hypothetical protein ACRDP8_03185 [Actinopolymorphaceae bacterium]
MDEPSGTTDTSGTTVRALAERLTDWLRRLPPQQDRIVALIKDTYPPGTDRPGDPARGVRHRRLDRNELGRRRCDAGRAVSG